jgi:dTDP-4-amino-4,6-dideoxygalactose transaminase
VLGPPVEELERAFAARGSAIGPGEEVITAANTCVPAVAGIEAAGATPVLADVDPETWTALA